MAQSNKSKIMKELWKNGHFDNRDESYREETNWKKNISNTVKELWKNGKIYNEARNKKISLAHKGKPNINYAILWNT